MNGSGGMNFFGAVLEGIAGGLKRKQEREDKKPVIDMQKKLLQLFESLTAQQQAKEQPEVVERPDYTPIQAPAPQPEGVTSQIAGMQLSDIDPMTAAFLSQTGIDFLGASRLATGQREFEISEQRRQEQFEHQKQQDLINLLLKLQETHPGVEVQTEGGGAQRIYPKKYQMKQQAPPSLTLQTKKAQGDQPIPLKDQPLWINPETMERAKPGMTPNQASQAGFRQITAGQLEKVQKITAVHRIMARVESLMEEVIPKKETIGRLGGLGREASAALQITNRGQKLAVLRDFVAANKAQVAKALGEVGNLSQTEQEDVIKGFGAIGDAGPKAWMQFKLLQDTFEDAKSNAFGVQGTAGKPTKNKILTKEKAIEFLQKSGGDKDKARKMAKDEGYIF